MKTKTEILKELDSLEDMACVLEQYEGQGTTSADWRALKAWREKLQAQLRELEQGETHE